MKNTKIITIISLILAASFSRLIPHVPNFTAVGAIALFSGAYLLDKRAAYIIPLVSLLITDLILGFHSSMFFVYGSVALTVFMGQRLLKSTQVKAVTALSFSSALLFFTITNFGHWLVSNMYPMTLSGLGACYVAGIPFFGYTIASQFFYTAILFGSFELAKKRFPVLSA